ncbi:MAG: ankyrin repeat domain-containing protein [Thermodesulfobacteriota bacterium]
MIASTTAADELCEALNNGDVDTVQRMIEKGANINTRCDSKGQTLIMIAAFNANPSIVKMLMDKGADINAADRNGKTALMHAKESKKMFQGIASNERIDKVVSILEAGGAR